MMYSLRIMSYQKSGGRLVNPWTRKPILPLHKFLSASFRHFMYKQSIKFLNEAQKDLHRNFLGGLAIVNRNLVTVAY